MDWREHPRLALVGVGLLAVALVVTCVRGCGCRRVSRAAPPPAAPTTAGKKVWMDDCPEPKAAPNAAAAKPSPPSAPRATPQPTPHIAKSEPGDDRPTKPGKPERPAEFADWTVNDYLTARRENDSRLLEAVAYLGTRFPDRTKAAELLLQLLEGPPSPGDSGDDGPVRRGSTPTAQLVEAIINALADNGAGAAREGLERLAAGTLKTCDNRGAAAAAVSVLLERASQENEDILFRIVTKAGQSKWAGGRAGERDTARTALLKTIAASAPTSFRIRLAKHMVAVDTQQTLFDELWPYLREARPENLGAQVLLYQSGRLDRPAVASVERQFLQLSSTTVRQLMGLPAVRERRQASLGEPVGPALVMEQLWNSQFVATLQRRLSTADTLRGVAGLMLLAGTIPNPMARAAVLRTMKVHCDEDPKVLKSPSLGADELTLEPGFLVDLKLRLRKDLPIWSGSDRVDRSEPPRTATRSPPSAAAQQWLAFTEASLRRFLGQFRTAAEATGSTNLPSDADEPLGPKPHPASEVVAAYGLDWPTGRDRKLAELSPLRVRYIRTDQRTRPAPVATYYHRLLPYCQEHVLPQSVWLDSLTPVAKGQSGVRSIDVLITRTDNDHPSLANRDQRLIVEILVVECEAIAARSRPDTSR